MLRLVLFGAEIRNRRRMAVVVVYCRTCRASSSVVTATVIATREWPWKTGWARRRSLLLSLHDEDYPVVLELG